MRRREVITGLGAIGITGTIAVTHLAPEYVPDGIEHAVLKGEAAAWDVAKEGVNSVSGLANNTISNAVTEAGKLPGNVGAAIAEYGLEMVINVAETEAINEILRARLVYEIGAGDAENARGNDLLLAINNKLGIEALGREINTKINEATSTLNKVSSDLSTAANTTVEAIRDSVTGFTNGIAKTANHIYEQEVLGIQVGSLTEALEHAGPIPIIGPALASFAVSFDKMAKEARDDGQMGQQKTDNLKGTLTDSAYKLDNEGLGKAKSKLNRMFEVGTNSAKDVKAFQLNYGDSMNSAKRDYSANLERLRAEHPDMAHIIPAADSQATAGEGISNAVWEGAKHRAEDVAEHAVENQALLVQIQLAKAASTTARTRAEAFSGVLDAMQEADDLWLQFESDVNTAMQTLEGIAKSLRSTINDDLKPLSGVISGFTDSIAESEKIIKEKIGNLLEAMARLGSPFTEFAKAYNDMAADAPKTGEEGLKKTAEVETTLTTSSDTLETVIVKSSDTKGQSPSYTLAGTQSSLQKMNKIERETLDKRREAEKKYKETLITITQTYSLELQKIDGKYKDKIDVPQLIKDMNVNEGIDLSPQSE